METSNEIGLMLRESAADFLSGRHSTQRFKGSIGEQYSFDRQLWKEMADLGWLGLALTEALGGLGMGLPEATVLTEQFGRSLFPEPFVAAALMPAVMLNVCPSSKAVDELAACVAAGESLVTVAWQEAVGQLDMVLPATRLKNARLSGRKCTVPAASGNGILLVPAYCEDGPALVAVAANGLGVLGESAATGAGSLTTFQFASAPILFSEPLLVGGGVLAALRTALDAALIAASAQLAGIAAACFEQTVRNIGTRMQFGRAIGSFQSIQHRCADLHIALQLADASWRHAERVHQAAPRLTANAAAISAAKARCGDVALQVGKAAVQMNGAMGFTEEADIGLYLRAAMQYSAWLGTPMLHRRRFLAAQSTGQTHV